MAPAAVEIVSAFEGEDGHQPFNYGDFMLAVSAVTMAGLIDQEGPTKTILVEPNCEREQRSSYKRESRDYTPEEVRYILAAIANRGGSEKSRTKRLKDFAEKYKSGGYQSIVAELIGE